MNQLIEEVRNLVFSFPDEDNSGHGNDHVTRVYNLAIKFSEVEESDKADKDVVALAALLHDVDDYKIVGKENFKKLTNSRTILAKLCVSGDIRERVLNIIKAMGYSNCLNGIRPVSDKGSGIIFDKKIYPNVNITQQEYNSNTASTSPVQMMQ